MITYDILKFQSADFGKALDIFQSRAEPGTAPLRLVFFGAPADNGVYREHYRELARQIDARWGAKAPVFSYVAQPPLDSALTLEIHIADKTFARNMRYGQAAGEKYIVIDDAPGKLLFTGGILPSDIDAPVACQSQEVLAKLGEILQAEQMPVDSIVRQWNYIENITMLCGDSQHYQDFNDARSHFYAGPRWESGYPAATGIGTSQGGIMVEADAAVFGNGANMAVALDNPLQIAAHSYSQEVLIGQPDRHFNERTTPKFERAKAIVINGGVETIYVSGTAAIRGEESLTGVGIEKQTVTTLENIEYLVSKENLKSHEVIAENEPRIKIFRVYLKSDKDLAPAEAIIAERYPGLPVLYVISDVCREELLIEIEGVAG